jgi:hypothetical protein
MSELVRVVVANQLERLGELTLVFYIWTRYRMAHNIFRKMVRFIEICGRWTYSTYNISSSWSGAVSMELDAKMSGPGDQRAAYPKGGERVIHFTPVVATALQ